MVQTIAPIVLNNLSITLKKVKNVDGSPAVGGAATEYRCQLGKAQVTPATSGGTGETYETFCEDHTAGATASQFTLDLAGFQAYKDVADLTVILWNDAGAIYEFVLTPQGGVISETNPGWLGQITVSEAAVGGNAKKYALFETSQPCVAKPVMITAPPVAEPEAAVKRSVA